MLLPAAGDGTNTHAHVRQVRYVYTSSSHTHTRTYVWLCVCGKTAAVDGLYTGHMGVFDTAAYVCMQTSSSLALCVPCSLYVVHAVLTAKRNSSGHIAGVSADRRRGRAPLRIVAKRIMPNLARAAFSYHHIIIAS